MEVAVRSVWAENFKAESRLLHQIAPRARHVALNVQYPGCVLGHGNGRSHRDLTTDERYEVIRANVALLRPLQVGIAVCTDDGRRFAWEFNLRGFDVASPKHARDPKSVAYLANHGVDFSRLPRDGIDGFRLRWLLRDSGLIRARPSWATFTGAYHVAYFVTMMYGEKLPDSVDDFMKMARKLIGQQLYDVKQLAREHDRSCVGALSNVVEKLTIMPPREGICKSKPAGTGSMLALLAFETLKEKLGPKMEKYRHELCGLQAV
ncbi:probable CCR4-associated factor 1 homolog 9 [Lolium perenne]|uniref:probable CCR4-associated factor 1 homolog 9 n=1 Tax=Lolium perenne TaxID=4522 RepID=UPI0021EB34DE|nr:probable CCR4-associated factor 1 homolog 9 [Lolium perenne]